jgi:hypothetical protein
MLTASPGFAHSPGAGLPAPITQAELVLRAAFHDVEHRPLSARAQR